MRIESLGIFNPLCISRAVVANRYTVPNPSGIDYKPCVTPISSPVCNPGFCGPHQADSISINTDAFKLAFEIYIAFFSSGTVPSVSSIPTSFNLTYGSTPAFRPPPASPIFACPGTVCFSDAFTISPVGTGFTFNGLIMYGECSTSGADPMSSCEVLSLFGYLEGFIRPGYGDSPLGAFYISNMAGNRAYSPEETDSSVDAKVFYGNGNGAWSNAILGLITPIGLTPPSTVFTIDGPSVVPGSDGRNSGIWSWPCYSP